MAIKVIWEHSKKQNPLLSNCWQMLKIFKALKLPSINLVEAEEERYHSILML